MPVPHRIFKLPLESSQRRKVLRLEKPQSRPRDCYCQNVLMNLAEVWDRMQNVEDIDSGSRKAVGVVLNADISPRLNKPPLMSCYAMGMDCITTRSRWPSYQAMRHAGLEKGYRSTLPMSE